MKETYTTARNRLLVALHEKGWTTKPFLKVPKAIKGDILITFHAQAVYCNGNSTFLDIRNMSVEDFLGNIQGFGMRSPRVL